MPLPPNIAVRSIVYEAIGLVKVIYSLLCQNFEKQNIKWNFGDHLSLILIFFSKFLVTRSRASWHFF